MGNGVPGLLEAADDAEPVHCRLGIFGENASDLAEDVLKVAERWRVILMSRAGNVDHVDAGLTWSARLDLLESQRL